jgi:hypothetical protein
MSVDRLIRIRALSEIMARLRAHRFPSVTEADLQAAIADVLTQAGTPFAREHRLDGASRIDFYLPDLRAGIEVKTQGSPNEVVSQLFRYATHEAIEVLALVTTRPRLGAMPLVLADVPLETLVLWEGSL